MYTLNKDGSYEKNWTRFWAFTKRKASELLNKDAIPGQDYAMFELVRCKSKNEIGVMEALEECTNLYFDKTLSLSNARIIIGFGGFVKNTLLKRYGFGDINTNLIGPQKICGKERVVVFLPHPNSRKKKGLNHYLNSLEIDKIKNMIEAGQ